MTESIKIPRLKIPTDFTAQQKKLFAFTQKVMNSNPEIILNAIEKHLDNQEPMATPTVPTLSLKKLIQLQKDQNSASESVSSTSDRTMPLVETPKPEEETNASSAKKPAQQTSTEENAQKPKPEVGSIATNDEPIKKPLFKFIKKTETPVVEEIISSNSETKKFEFDASQAAARAGMLREQFCCLIGAAGTGKTKTLKDHLEDIKDEIEMMRFAKRGADDENVDETKKYEYRLGIVFCAFTGRAVEQMKKALPKEYHNSCGTIHGDRVLNYVPEFYDDIDPVTGNYKQKVRFVPSFDENRKLPYSVYVIDETGMLSVELWNTLRKAMLPTAKVILVGDINQLPPVYGRSVLGFAMVSWPVFELTTIHRQAQDNPIIANAHRILRGEVPKAVDAQFDMVDLKDRGSEPTAFYLMQIIQHLHKKGSFDPFKDGIIVPQNVSAIGQVALNELMLTYFNPPNEINKRYVIKTGMATVHYQVNDKVMMLANDKNTGLTNGQIGKVVSIRLNGNYRNSIGVSQHDLARMHTTEVAKEDSLSIDDFKNMMVDTNGKADEQEMSQRQASHIVTVRFGDPEPEIEEEYNKVRMQLDMLIDPVSRNHTKKYRELIDVKYKELLEYKGNDPFIQPNDAHKIIDDEMIYPLQKRCEELEREIQKQCKEVVFSTAGQFRLLGYAYVITCHKSQGGEYPTVVVLVHSANQRLLSREWLYTAVTRAQKRVVLVYNQRGLGRAIQTQRIKGTTLKEKIKAFLDFSIESSKDTQIPDLPDAKKMKEEVN